MLKELAVEEGKLIDVTEHTYKANTGGKVYVTDALYCEIIYTTEAEIECGHTPEKRIQHLLFTYTVSRTGEDIFNFKVTNMMQKGEKFMQVISRVRAVEGKDTLTLALENEW